MAEDVAWLLPTDAHLGAIDKELHVHAVICNCHMRPLVGHITSVRVDGGHFVGAISFKGEEEAGVTIPVFTNRLDAKQPATVTGGVKTFVVQTWGERENEKSKLICSSVLIYRHECGCEHDKKWTAVTKVWLFDHLQKGTTSLIFLDQVFSCQS